MKVKPGVVTPTFMKRSFDVCSISTLWAHGTNCQLTLCGVEVLMETLASLLRNRRCSRCASCRTNALQNLETNENQQWPYTLRRQSLCQRVRLSPAPGSKARQRFRGAYLWS